MADTAMADATEVVHSTMSLDTPANMSDEAWRLAGGDAIDADAALAAAAIKAAKRAEIMAKVAAARLEQAQQVEASKGGAKKARPEDFFTEAGTAPVTFDKTFSNDSIKNERLQGVFG